MFFATSSMVTTATQPVAPLPGSRPRRVAPWWHTAVVLFFLLVPLSTWLPIKNAFPSFQPRDLPLYYILELMFQWCLFAILYLGLLVGGTELRDLLGRGWHSGRDFFRDLGLGVAFSVLDISLIMLLSWVFGIPHSKSNHLDPHTVGDLLGWIPVAVSAGFIEEVTCRGYLQRQFEALTGKWIFALIIQAAIFSVAHGYDQPLVLMFEKFAFGVGFGILALWRKSLLPGILGHAGQDSLAGVLLVGLVG